MQRHYQRAGLWALAASWMLLMSACSSKPVFQVNYLLPQAPTAAYAHKKVYVTAEDGRGTGQFLQPGAQKELADFSGLFSLVVLKSDGIGDLLGAYETVPLIKALCEQRLLASAVGVSDGPAPGAGRFEIILRDFALDYIDRKWVARMSYEAVAFDPDGGTRRQIVTGSAERVKLWGRREAEKLIGELASDMINKLDLERLLGRN